MGIQVVTVIVELLIYDTVMDFYVDVITRCMSYNFDDLPYYQHVQVLRGKETGTLGFSVKCHFFEEEVSSQ